jgi:hypothetical protein
MNSRSACRSLTGRSQGIAGLPHIVDCPIAANFFVSAAFPDPPMRVRRCPKQDVAVGSIDSAGAPVKRSERRRHCGATERQQVAGIDAPQVS